MPAFWAFNHITLNERWAAGACEGPTVGYIECKAAFRTTQYMFLIRFQYLDSPINTHKLLIKTFPIYSLKSNLRTNVKLCFVRCGG